MTTKILLKKNKFAIKKGDNVQVIAGDDKGKTGMVLKVNVNDAMVLVSGINLVKKATKPTQDGLNFITSEREIHISNVKIVENNNSSSQKKKSSSKVKKSK